MDSSDTNFIHEIKIIIKSHEIYGLKSPKLQCVMNPLNYFNVRLVKSRGKYKIKVSTTDKNFVRVKIYLVYLHNPYKYNCESGSILCDFHKRRKIGGKIIDYFSLHMVK